MPGDIKMYKHAAIMSQHNECKENAKSGAGNGEENYGYDFANMVIQEGSPSL